MPYQITPKISVNSPGEWFEGDAYSVENIYRIEEGKMPPVHYDSHTLKPHSLTHIETPKHTQLKGPDITSYLQKDPYYFYGPCLVIKFQNEGWVDKDNKIKHKVISKDELEAKLNEFGPDRPDKILISVEGVPENINGYHDPSWVLTLSIEAATYLTSIDGFNLFGTSWKSSDYNPGGRERPVHNELFKKALILENINLNKVPEGAYFLSAFPLPLEGASESPVNAVLFEPGELI